MEIKIKKSTKFYGYYEMYLDDKICRIVDETGVEMEDAYEILLSLFPSGMDGSLHESGSLYLENDNGSDFDEVKRLLKTLTDNERLELFADYCKHCGNDNPECQCWNDN